MMMRIVPIECINYWVRGWMQTKLPKGWGFNITSAVVGGLSATSLIYPSDILRQYMNNNTKSRLTVLDAIKTIYKNYGFKYFYKGYPNFCMTMCTYRTFYNGTFDTFKFEAKNIYQKGLIAYLCTLLSEFIVFPIEGVRRRRIVINS